MAIDSMSKTFNSKRAYPSTETPDLSGPRSPYHTSKTALHDEENPQSVFDILELPAQLSAVTTRITHIREPDADDTFPDGGTRSWIVILGCFFLLMATYGMMNSTGVLQNYFATQQLSGYSASAVGWIRGLFTLFGL